MTNSKIKTNIPPKKKAANIQADKLHIFEGHSFKVLDDEDMGSLIESIRQQGIISPLIVRAIESTDEYEVISGHRRLHAAVKAGLSEVPALIYPLDRNEAMIAVVDSNLHRERLLPSEKAFAYKMKMDAMKAQGRRTDLTLSQAATKSDTAAEIGKSQNESRDQVFRYIRLTYLIPELFDKVDEGIIALSPAVELSYLSKEQQKILLDAMSLNDCTPSHAQSIRMKKQAQQNTLSSDGIYEIMSEEKGNQTERISFKVQDLKGFFPKNFTQKQMTDTILKLLYEYNRKLERSRRSREER
ncbi:ParB/RepB/Spo0J family partition protein [Lachnospiraceae bacterium 48-42]